MTRRPGPWSRIPQSKRRRILAFILERDGPACRLCGALQALAPTIDHIVAVVHRPDLMMTPTNWQVACKRCNQYKGAGGPATPQLGPLSPRWQAMTTTTVP